MVRYLNDIPVHQESYHNFRITRGSRKGSFGGTRVPPIPTGMSWYAGIFLRWVVQGYIKLHRAIEDNDLWFKEKFNQAQAWIDLLLLANHKQGAVCIRGIDIKIDRGQVGWSMKSLAKRWKWSRGKVKRFFSNLEQQNMVKTDIPKTLTTSVITIVNYNQYQSNEQQKSGKTDIRRTSDGHQTDTNKNEKKEILTKFPSSLTTDNFKITWAEWEQHRKEIKKPMTPTARTKMLNKLDKWGEVLAIKRLNTAMANGWTGVHEDDTYQRKSKADINAGGTGKVVL